MSDQWIKFSEQSPRDSEFPPEHIWLWAPCTNNPAGVRVLWEMRCGTPADKKWTHWQPATVPEPPKCEPTQAEADQQACLKHWRLVSLDFANDNWPGPDFAQGFRDGIAYERGQVRAMLGETVRWDGPSMRNALGDGVPVADTIVLMSENVWNNLAIRVGFKR